MFVMHNEDLDFTNLDMNKFVKLMLNYDNYYYYLLYQNKKKVPLEALIVDPHIFVIKRFPEVDLK